MGLQSGNYEVTVSSPGFAVFKATQIYLETAGTYTVKAVLKAGDVTSTVTVNESQAEVQTSTDEISSTVSGEEAQELPLNGRNYQALGSLMPGVINTSPDTALGTGGFNTTNVLNVNGGGAAGSLYTVDGIWNENTGSMTQTTITPNPESIAETKVFQNNYSAEYTLMGASVVMVQTKSGTDVFHGGVWEYLRNTFLDTRNYFVPVSTGVSPEEWNIYGLNLGGPVFIPHIYEAGRKKTFFYFNLQWVKQKQASVNNGASPTAAMRGQGTPGNGAVFPAAGALYGGTIKDPTTGQPFPNNTIPSTRINQANLALLNAMAPLPNNQGTAFNNYINTKPTLTNQYDEEFKIDHNISSKLRLTGEYFYEPADTINPNAARMGSPFPTDWDTFSTDNQLAEVQLTQFLTPTMTNQTSIAMNNYDVTHDFGGIHTIEQVPGFSESLPYSGGVLQNYLPRVQPSGGWSQFGANSGNVTARATDLEDTVTDNWSWSRRKHFLQAGVTFLFGTKRQWAQAGPPVNGIVTFTGTFTGNAVADYLLGDSATFQQSQMLLRKYIHYPIYSPYVEDQWKATKRLTISAGLRFFYMPWPTTQQGYTISFDPITFIPANAPAVSAKGIITSTPTYNPANGLVVNGENGVPLDLTNAHNFYYAPTAGFAWDVYGNGKTALRGGYGIAYNKSAGEDCAQNCLNSLLVGSVSVVNVNFPDPVGGGSVPVSAPAASGDDLKNIQATRVQTYSLSIQQQFGSDWILSIAGAGDTASDQRLSVNINQPLPSGGYDFNPLLNTPNYTAAYFAPYQGYAGIGIYKSIGITHWSALEVSLRHPVGHNLYLTGAYTWSHNMDNITNQQNAYAPGADYGNSNLNTPQVFTTAVIYSLPRFKSSPHLKQEVLGGWKYSDMTTVQSGSSLNIGMSLANTGLATRPNQVAPLTYPKTYSQWFSKNSYAQPAAGYFGNAKPGSILGPGVVAFNMALYKDFAIREGMALEFRSEFFNVFNHTNPNSPNTSLGAGGFGQITSAKDPRIGELALKLTF